MDKVNNLIGHTQDVFDRHNKSENYDSIYFHSNEYLGEIFDEVNVKAKDVLTVLGSGDHALHMYDRGAKNIDLFDKNNLTLYYYYLRKWVIEYKNNFYPKRKIDSSYIGSVISCVSARTDEEKDALVFWDKLLNSCCDVSNLFIFDRNLKKNKINSLKLLRKILSEKNFVFHNIDLSDYINLDKKYDVIYKSNISDYVSSSDKVLYVYRDNLYSLLNDDEIIISSNLCHDYYYSNEFDIFDSLFRYELFDNGEGFIYKKRR